MNRSDGWTEVVAPVPLDQVEQAFSEWKSTVASRRNLADDDVRVDVMRTLDGERARVLVRISALPTEALASE